MLFIVVSLAVSTTKLIAKMRTYKYKVIWTDCAGEEHRKLYVSIETAIKKTFAVYGWYKNGACIRLSDNTVILGNL